MHNCMNCNFTWSAAANAQQKGRPVHIRRSIQLLCMDMIHECTYVACVLKWREH